MCVLNFGENQQMVFQDDLIVPQQEDSKVPDALSHGWRGLLSPYSVLAVLMDIECYDIVFQLVYTK